MRLCSQGLFDPSCLHKVAFLPNMWLKCKFFLNYEQRKLRYVFSKNLANRCSAGSAMNTHDQQEAALQFLIGRPPSLRSEKVPTADWQAFQFFLQCRDFGHVILSKSGVFLLYYGVNLLLFPRFRLVFQRSCKMALLPLQPVIVSNTLVDVAFCWTEATCLKSFWPLTWYLKRQNIAFFRLCPFTWAICLFQQMQKLSLGQFCFQRLFTSFF